MRSLGEKILASQADSLQIRRFQPGQLGLGFGFSKRSLDIFENPESVSNDGVSVADVRGFTSMIGVKQDRFNLRKDAVCLDGNTSWLETVTDKNHQFAVGDFVWGKIRTHFYWPGRVYDPSEASDYVAKFKQGGHILVAFYDGKFSWCEPSQLEPFVENFESMSRQSNSNNFVHAVEEAVDEFGRLLQLQMTCSCAPQGMQFRSLTANSCSPKGIQFRALTTNSTFKKGFFVPLDGAGKLLIARYESTVLIAALRDIAQNVYANGMLELAMLKSWLSAFYWAKGGYRLPVYQEPQRIMDLEGNNMKSLIYDVDHIDVPIQAQTEDPLVSLPTGPQYGQTDQFSSVSSVQQHLKVSEDELYQRRKQKSVAELMVEDGVDIEPENMWAHMSTAGTLAGNNFSMPASERMKESGALGSDVGNQLTFPLGRKRGRKLKLQVPITTENQDACVENGELGSQSGDQLTSPLGRKRGRKPKVQGPFTTDNQDTCFDNGELGSHSGNQLTSPLGRKKGRKPKLQDLPTTTENHDASVESDGFGNHSANQLIPPLGRKRGRKPKLHGPTTTENQDTCIENGELGSHSNNQLNSSLGRKRGRKPKLQVSSIATENQDSDLEHDGGRVIEENYKSSLTVDGGEEDKLEIKRGLLPRKRKRSKYLSPPYTADVMEMLANSGFISDSETECNETSNVDQKELQIRPGVPILGFSPISKCDGNTIETNTFNGHGDGRATIEDPSSQAPKQEKVVVIDTKDVEASPCEFLAELQYAALSLQNSMASEKLNMISRFFTLFRSSMYRDGSNYQVYHKTHCGQKRKSDPKPGSMGRKTLIQTLDHIQKSGGGDSLQKKGEARLDVSKLKRAPVASDAKTDDDNDGISSSPALYVSFPPVFSMPTKENLIAMYKRFGALIETETDVFYNSFSARIVFARTGDAQRAYNESAVNSPFGASKVTFSLRYPSGFPRVQDVHGDSTMRAPSLPEEGSRPLENRSSIQLDFLEKKLKMVTEMVKSANGNLSQEMKSDLENEIKGMLEKVRTMEVSTPS